MKIYSMLFFKDIPISKADALKYFDLHLDSILYIDIYVKIIFTKENVTIGLLQKLPQVLPFLFFFDVTFDPDFNNFFHQRLKSIPCNAALVITGAIRGTSKKKIYQELGFESRIISLLQNNKKLISIISLSSNSKAIKYIFYS